MVVSWIKRKIGGAKQYIRWFKRLHPGKKAAYLIASPTYENVGDIAIAFGMEEFLLQHGYDSVVDITTTEFWSSRQCIRRLLPSNALICLIGGGNMGDVYQLEENNRRTVLGDFPNHRVVIFPQTIYYTDEQAKLESVPHYNRENLTIAAREQQSYEIIKMLYPRANIILAPDVVLSMNYSRESHARQGIVACFRGDREQLLPTEEKEKLLTYLRQHGYDVTITDMMHGASIPRESRRKIVEEKKDVFARAQLVITDRLHAMILCVISGTPCLVFGNNHHKVRGVYEWVKHLDYISFIHSTDEVIDKLEEFLAKDSNSYTPRAEDFRALEEAVRPH